jgi:hypothetical protein
VVDGVGGSGGSGGGGVCGNGWCGGRRGATTSDGRLATARSMRRTSRASTAAGVLSTGAGTLPVVRSASWGAPTAIPARAAWTRRPSPATTQDRQTRVAPRVATRARFNNIGHGSHVRRCPQTHRLAARQLEAGQRAAPRFVGCAKESADYKATGEPHTYAYTHQAPSSLRLPGGPDLPADNQQATYKSECRDHHDITRHHPCPTHRPAAAGSLRQPPQSSSHP